MGLLQTILEAQNGGIIKQLASASGLDNQSAASAVAKLLGGLNKGVQKNTANPGGLEALMATIQGGNHDRYLSRQDAAFSPAAQLDGNSILGHILGNKDASRGLAGQVAKETGISSGILKKMLPIVATLAMGALKKQSSSGGGLGQLFGGGIGRNKQEQSMASGLLSSFLDKDRDGSIVDDLLGMAAKQFFR